MAYVKAQLSVPQIEDVNGNPAAGYTINSYIWDTSTPTPMYTSSAGAGSATSFTLNSLGQPQSAGGTAVDIFLDTDITYKFIVRDAGNQPVGPTIGPINASDGTASTITFLQSGAGAVERESNSKMAEIISVSDFGVSPSKTPEQNKAAMDVAIASLVRPTLLTFPSGYFPMAPDIDIGTFVVGIEGQGKYQTYIVNNTAIAGVSMFKTPDAQSAEYCFFKDFGIDGGGAIANGIRMLNANHNLYENLLITATTTDALRVNGYSNDIVGCDIFTNTGSGITLSGTLNNVNVTRNRIYANSGIGIILNSTNTDAGLQINIKENAIEANAVAGIIALNTKALNICDNYFERNATAGYHYSDPETITIRADIHLLADSTFAINNATAYSNKNATVRGNHCTPIGYGTALPNLDGFIFTSYANNLRVENNEIIDGSKITSIVSLYMNRARSTINNHLIISANTVNNVNYIGTFDVNTERFDASHLIRIDGSTFFANYANRNFFEWGVLDGTTGTLERTGNVFDKQNSWAITDGDRHWGVVIDLTVNSELRGNWVWFGCFVNDLGANTNAKLHIDGQSSRSNTPAGGLLAWQFQSVTKFVDNAATSMSIGIVKIGTGGPLLINGPILAIVGNECRRFQSSNPEYRAAAAPSAGSWGVGDRVINNAPAVGQPKAWVCTVAGVPGTWVSEGNL